MRGEGDELGREFNLFKALRRVFRTSAGCRAGERKVSAVILTSDAIRPGSQPAQAGAKVLAARSAPQQTQGEAGRRDRVGWGRFGCLRARPKPGRGFNLFRALRRVSRAISACGGLVDAVVDRVAALRRASVRTPVSRRAMERGYRARRNPGRRIQPFQGLAPDLPGDLRVWRPCRCGRRPRRRAPEGVREDARLSTGYGARLQGSTQSRARI